MTNRAAVQTVQPNGQPMTAGPRTVISAKRVDLALVTYMDESNQQVTQLAVVGDKHIHLLESRSLGFSKNTTPQGLAGKWLTEGVFKQLEGKKE